MPKAVCASSRVRARDRPGPRPRVATKGAKAAWVSVMRRLYNVGGVARHLANIRPMLAAPEHLAVEDEGRDTEHAVGLGRPADGVHADEAFGEEGREGGAV